MVGALQKNSAMKLASRRYLADKKAHRANGKRHRRAAKSGGIDRKS
jgi:hypothetical protein